MIQAKIIADSISESGKRLTTMQLCYQRFIHAEFMTHRVFSRNASSSRAIPVAKMIEQVRTNPAMPIHFGKNQAGMQAHEELTGNDLEQVRITWREAANDAADKASYMNSRGAHKQVVNRILEPFQWIHVIVTATEWGNFFELRAHEDAQPEIHELAIQMRAAMEASTPTLLVEGEWHLPYVGSDDYSLAEAYLEALWRRGSIEAWADEDVAELLRKVSAARCCRISYLKHDGTPASIEEELALCDRLIGARPLHASPFEHQATPDVPLYADPDVKWENPNLHGNLIGWVQHRKLIEDRFK